jgi:hypothetical protein
MANTYNNKRVLESLADSHGVRKHSIVKCVCEGHHCIIFNLIFITNTDYMACSCFQEDSSDEFRVTGSDKDKVKFGSRCLNQFLKLILAYQLAITFISFKQ